MVQCTTSCSAKGPPDMPCKDPFDSTACKRALQVMYFHPLTREHCTRSRRPISLTSGPCRCEQPMLRRKHHPLKLSWCITHKEVQA